VRWLTNLGCPQVHHTFLDPQEIPLFSSQITNFYHQGVVPHLFPECGVCEVEDLGLFVSLRVCGPFYSVTVVFNFVFNKVLHTNGVFP